MSVASLARLPSGPKMPSRSWVEGTRRCRGRRRTLPVARSLSDKRDEHQMWPFADVASDDDADVVSVSKTTEGMDTATTSGATRSRRELITAAVSLATATINAPFGSCASAAEPTLVGLSSKLFD